MENNEGSKIIQALDKYSTSPTALQRAVLETVKDITGNNHGIISPENPVAMVLEMASTLTAGHMAKAFNYVRKQYPVSAVDAPDLYPHLTERDWINAFAVPSTGKFTLSFLYEELLQLLREHGNEKLLRIPRGTKITVGGIDFLLEYPVNIVQKVHGGFNCLYDTSVISPIHTLTTNVVDYTFSDIGEVRRMNITVEMVQVTRTTVEHNINTNTPVRISKTFNDDYFHARVYTGNGENEWKELVTTHSPDIFDTTTPTSVLKLLQGKDNEHVLEISVPIVYNQGKINPGGLTDPSPLGNRLKADIYSTVGSLKMNLGEYYPSQFEISFYHDNRIDKTDKLFEYSANLNSVSDLLVYSNHYISQGRDMLPFKELRERVINNTVGPNNIPVSHAGISDKLVDNGFKIVKAVDYVSQRLYWAVKDTPEPESDKLLSDISVGIERLTTSFDKLAGLGTVKIHHEKATITPDTLFKSVNGKLYPLSDGQLRELNQLPLNERIDALNKANYYYTPFHYQVDVSGKSLEMKAYYFDSPKVVRKTFVQGNDSTDITLTIKQVEIERSANGYRLLVSVISNDAYKEYTDDNIFAHARINAFENSLNVYSDGKLMGRDEDGEPIFAFDIHTSFHIIDSRLEIDNFTVRSTGAYKVTIPFDIGIDLIFGVYGSIPEYQPTSLDSEYGSHLNKSPNACVLVCEKVHLNLGHSLDYLWTNTLSYPEDIIYKRHPKNEPLLYTEDIYEADKTTGSIVNYKDGNITYNLVHRKGDPVLDADGQPMYKHKEGDLVLDENGKPIVVSERTVGFALDIFLMDASYKFCTRDDIVQYRNDVVATYIDWLVDDLKPLNDKTLEQTEIKLRPISGIGKLDVIYNNGIKSTIPGEHSFIVNFTVTKQIYEDNDVRKKISDYTVRVINKALRKDTVSVSSIISDLIRQHGSDIIGVSISGIGNDPNIITYTTTGTYSKATIRKRLFVEADNTVALYEDVTCNFIEHSSY